jgi:uncharacterized protein
VTPANTSEPLSLAHRECIEPLLERLGPCLSEHVFANLYLFRAVHDYRLRRAPIPHILGLTYDKARHAMPLAPCDASIANRLLESADCLYPLAGVAGQDDESRFRVSWNEDDSDYLYEAQRLAALGGPRLRDKRRQASSFASVAKPSIRTLDRESRHHAYAVLDLWSRQVAPLHRETDYEACREALDCLEALGMGGMLVTAAGKACAFLLFSRLSQDTVVVHFAKGDRELDGLYPYLFSQFAAQAGVPWLNLEQDLGKVGLRQAKRALDPTRRLRKFRLALAPSTQAGGL